MYDVPVSFSIYMKQVTQLIDVPIGVADKSPGFDLLKKSQWFCGYKFGSKFNAHVVFRKMPWKTSFKDTRAIQCCR